jgi:hypothetical protein
VCPQLRKARQGLEAVLTPEDMPIPQNRLAEIRRDMAWLAMLREQIKAIEKTRLERLQQAPRQGPHAMVLVLARIIGAGVDNADMLVREILSKNSPRTCQEFAKDLRDEPFGGRRSGRPIRLLAPPCRIAKRITTALICKAPDRDTPLVLGSARVKHESEKAYR